jgi:hypothetical protein
MWKILNKVQEHKTQHLTKQCIKMLRNESRFKTYLTVVIVVAAVIVSVILVVVVAVVL